MNPNQLAYQNGKSCESALHTLGSKIEQAISYKEIPPAAFFDIASTNSIVSKLVSRGAEQIIMTFITNMPSSRQKELCVWLRHKESEFQIRINLKMVFLKAIKHIKVFEVTIILVTKEMVDKAYCRH